MPSYPAALPQPADLTPLEAFPWLTRSGPAALPAVDQRRSPSSARITLMRQAGIAAAFGALCGAALWLAGDPLADPAPPAQPARPPQSMSAPAQPALGESTDRPGAAASDEQPPQDAAKAAALPAPTKAHARRSPAAPAAQPAAIVRTTAPPPRIAPDFARGASLGAELTAPAAASPAQPADSRASAATVEEFRRMLDQGRDTARAVIRLASRQKPARGASPEELHGYRIRQQNAETARNYRSYLDTLARLMRGKPAELTARQSRDNARQTLAYLETLLAQSQATLR